MRTVQHQLLHLLSEQEVADLKVNEVFRPFEPLSPLHHSPYAKPAWDAATSEYMKAMQPVEREVARKLHKRLTSSGLKGHALLRDCLRHKELVLRPMVFAELAPAREALLGQMEGQLEDFQRMCICLGEVPAQEKIDAENAEREAKTRALQAAAARKAVAAPLKSEALFIKTDPRIVAPT